MKRTKRLLHGEFVRASLKPVVLLAFQGYVYLQSFEYYRLLTSFRESTVWQL
jgi:hypothetical protein